LSRGLYIFRSPYEAIVTVHVIEIQYPLIPLHLKSRSSIGRSPRNVDLYPSEFGEAKLRRADQALTDPSISTPARKVGSAQRPPACQDWTRRKRRN
jgi:hypothetical protein